MAAVAPIWPVSAVCVRPTAVNCVICSLYQDWNAALLAIDTGALVDAVVILLEPQHNLYRSEISYRRQGRSDHHPLSERRGPPGERAVVVRRRYSDLRGHAAGDVGAGDE